MRNKFSSEELEAKANDLLDRGDLECGDTQHFNHVACGDSRGRGYLSCKRTESHSGGLVDLFYCHNCGASDARTRGGWLRRPAPPVTSQEAEGKPSLPSDILGMASDSVPSHIRTWADGYRVSAWAAWSPSMDRIVMPVTDPFDGNLLGYQARRDPEGSTKVPKYLTVCGRTTPLRLLVPPDKYLLHQTNTVVIVEDWVSAHQFYGMTGVWGAALLGTNATAEYLLWVDTLLKQATRMHPNYVIWLDNDVKKTFEVRDYILRLLTALGRYAHVEPACRDPKHYTEPYLVNKVKTLTTGIK